MASQAQINAIARMAQAKGLDPKAVLAIASHEGLSGGVGDQGTSFGPFQLHIGGALPKQAGTGQHAQQWAWSNAGLNYALNQMASVARGLTGRQAVAAISKRFERPADPAAEISDAMAHYGQIGGAGPAVGGGPVQGQLLSHGTKTATKFDAALYRKQAGAIMLQSAVQMTQQGVTPTPGQPPAMMGDIFGQLEAARKAATIKVNVASGMPALGGGKAGAGGGGLGAKAVALASKQIGIPYVWGGTNPRGPQGGAGSGFDCSGLTQYVYKQLGISIPRLAADQGKAGKAVSYANLRPGDLLVENNGDHVVMYAGNGKVIQAPHTGEKVQYAPLSWFPKGQYNARRIA
jgi:cell wall-associated NlpC family hydrolase